MTFVYVVIYKVDRWKAVMDVPKVVPSLPLRVRVLKDIGVM